MAKDGRRNQAVVKSQKICGKISKLDPPLSVWGRFPGATAGLKC